MPRATTSAGTQPGVLYCSYHMASLGLTAVLGVHQKQRLVGKNIHQPRDTATRELDRPQGEFVNSAGPE